MWKKTEDGIEIIWVKVRMNQRTLPLGNMYGPPNTTSSVMDSLELMLERAASEWKDVVLMGDLNLNWLACSRETSRLQQYNNLKQMISAPTHIANHSQTLINLLFTTNPEDFTQLLSQEVTICWYLGNVPWDWNPTLNCALSNHLRDVTQTNC